MGVLRKEIPKDIFENVLKDCIDKVDGVNDLDWQDIVEKYSLNIHRDVLRKAFSSPLGGYPVYNFMKNKIESNIQDNEVLKEIENKKIELEKEKIKFQDQRREYKKYIRKDARWEHIVNTLKNEVENINKKYPLRLNSYLGCIDIGTNHAVLTCSDWHIGAKFKNYFEEFNIDIAKKRVKYLLDKTIEHCKLHKVNTLHVEICGDNIEGAIHTQNKVESDEDVVSQTMTVAEMFSEFISELSLAIPNIKVYHCIGNHSRVNPNIKENMDKENFERIIPWYIKSRVQSPNVEFVENKISDDIIVYDVLNTKIVTMHGDKDNINNVLNNTLKMLKIFPDEIHLGHYHKHYENEEFDCEISINGSLKGTDSYAKNIRKSGTAMQKLKIYNEKGQLCTYKIKFK